MNSAQPRLRRVVRDHPLAPTFVDRPPLSRNKRVPRLPRTLRIILLTQYFPPEVGATQTRMQSFAEYLASRGHEVTVICEIPNHPHGVIAEDYRGLIYEDDRSNPYRVLRVWVQASAEKTQKTRLQFYLSYMTTATAIAPLAGAADIVFATSPPLFTAVAGAAIAKLKGAAFVLDVRDLWPAAAVSLKQISTGRTLKAAEQLERWLYRLADLVTCVTRPFCDHVDNLRHRAPAAVYLPNGTLDQFFTNGDRDYRSKFGIPADRYLIVFAGTLGIAQALPAVIEAAGRVDGSAEFAFVGEGPMKRALVDDVRKRSLKNVHFFPEVPLADVPGVLCASDALLVTLSAHPTFADFVPSKLLDCMASGRPVIVSATGESARIVDQAGAGVVVSPEDPAALESGVRWLIENRAAGREMGERGRNFARRFPRRVQAERLECLLLDVVKTKRT